MAYGRIDVYWPDGPIESFQVDKNSVAIGRSTGNDIVLETNAISRYHISIGRKEDKVFVEDLDSANGTYVDGTRLKSHDPYPLNGGEEIQIGDIRLVFNPLQEVDSSSTKPIFIEESLLDTRRIELSQPSFSIEIDPPTQPVTPGAYIQTGLTIHNTSNKPEHYVVEVDGLPHEWVRLDRGQMELEPDDYGSVVISFKPLRRSETTPGDYSVILRVKADAGEAINAVVKLTLRSFSGFGMALGLTRVQEGEPFELHLHNQGNDKLTLALSGAAPGGGLQFNLQPPMITLKAGERRTLQGTVQMQRKPLVGGSDEHRFDLLARSQDASGFLAAVEGSLVVKPTLPLWVPTLFIPLILLALIAGGVIIAAVLTRPHTPVITGLSVSPSSVLEGESVQISWAATNTSLMTVSMDNNPPVSVDPASGKFAQVMSTAGSHIFSIEARNGDERVRQDVRVTVAKALKINAFAVSPNPLLRNIRQDVTITWDVQGANSVNFVGIEALTGKPDANIQPITGSIVLNGTPRDSMDLKLIAIGSNGKQVEQSVHVDIKNPSCLVANDKTNIRSGPGLNYPVINTYAVGTALQPDGRDQTNGWIHLVPAPDAQAWVQVSDIKCPDFDPASLTAIVSVPPTPEPSAITPSTPQPTSAPTESGFIF